MKLPKVGPDTIFVMVTAVSLIAVIVLIDHEGAKFGAWLKGLLGGGGSPPGGGGGGSDSGSSAGPPSQLSQNVGSAIVGNESATSGVLQGAADQIGENAYDLVTAAPNAIWHAITGNDLFPPYSGAGSSSSSAGGDDSNAASSPAAGVHEQMPDFYNDDPNASW